MSNREYRIKEYNDTTSSNGVRSVIKQYRAQYRDNTFINRLFGGGWSNLTEYPYNDAHEARQAIKNDKIKRYVEENKSIKYINVD